MAATTISITASAAAYQLVSEGKGMVRLQVNGPDAVRVHVGEALPSASTDNFFTVHNHLLLEDLGFSDNVYVRAESKNTVVRAIAWTPGDAGNALGVLTTQEEVATNGDTATELSLEVYQSVITTGGSEGAEEATLGDGTGAIVGQRKLITLDTLTHASDSVTLDHANFAVPDETITAIELDAAGEFLLAEWNGAKWQVIYASAGVVTVSG